MVVRIDVTEGRREAIGIFLLLFFDFSTHQVSRRQYPACVRTFSYFSPETPTPPLSPRKPPDGIRLKPTPKAHGKLRLWRKQKKKKKKKNLHEKSTYFGGFFFLLISIVVLMRSHLSPLSPSYLHVVCLQDFEKVCTKERTCGTCLFFFSSTPSPKSQKDSGNYRLPEQGRIWGELKEKYEETALRCRWGRSR